MKKFLCAILAIGMLCGAAALVGCKKNNGGNSSSSSGGHNNNSNVEVPGEWETPEEGIPATSGNWGV